MVITKTWLQKERDGTAAQVASIRTAALLEAGVKIGRVEGGLEILTQLAELADPDAEATDPPPAPAEPEQPASAG